MAREQVSTLMPDEFHAHLRNGPMATWMVDVSIENGFRERVLGMPNTKPNALLTAEDVNSYLKFQIQPALARHPFRRRFTYVSTIQITKHTTPEIVYAAKVAGVRAGKTYPKDVTTNSELGVVNYEAEVYPAYRAMEEVDMMCCLHCEDPSDEVEGLHKEAKFLAILEGIRSWCPKLKIVVEHVSTAVLVEWVKRQPKDRVRATIAPQYLANTLDDVIGYGRRSGCAMQFHNGCKPMPKFRLDRETIREAAISGGPRFFFASDTAPHLKAAKHEGACGCFSTPVSLPFLIQFFKERGAFARLDPFLARFGAEYYGYPPTQRRLVFEEDPWIVPNEYPVPGTGDAVVPLFKGEEMRYKLVS